MDDPTHIPGAPRKTLHSIADSHHRDGVQDRPTYTAPRERNAALRAFGEVVYAVRCGDVVKIGHTTDLAVRLRQLHGEIIAFRQGTYDDEQTLHARLVDHLHHGREWYYPTPGVMAVVNEMRATIGLDPIAA